jgi:hypothetical protein
MAVWMPNIDKSSWEGENVVKETTLNKIIETLNDRWLHHGERKLILNENDPRAMFISWNFNIQLIQYIYLNNVQWDSETSYKTYVNLCP